MYTNAYSIVGKINELRVIVQDLDPDIVAITEAWTNDSITNSYLALNGFSLITRCDREDTSAGKGGGILVYVRETMNAAQIPNQNNFIQSCSIEINLSASNLPIHIIYRPPSSTVENNEKLNQFIQTVCHPAILIGDFNFPGISWTSMTSNAHGRNFLQASQDAFMTQHVDFPTHQNGNILDLVLSSAPNLISKVTEEGKLGNSDHSIICVEVNRKPTVKDSNQLIYDFHKADLEKLRKLISDHDWVTRFAINDVEAMWNIFKEMMHNSMAECIPMKIR